VRTLQVIHLIITSPARAVAKYCDECVCLSVCLSDIAGILESRAFLQLKEHGKIVSRTATLELGRWSFFWDYCPLIYSVGIVRWRYLANVRNAFSQTLQGNVKSLHFYLNLETDHP